MRKATLSFLFIAALCITAVAQQPAKNPVADDLKKELISKLSLTEDVATRITKIEDEFYTLMAAATSMPDGTLSQKRAREDKMHAAHVARREKLVALPLTDRQMEDAVEISDRLHRTEKKA